MAEMEIHPLADLFPMMSDDELADLAADIKTHGLIHPIVTDDSGKILIDGRNRLRACEVAGVEPTFRKLNGGDVPAFIVSVNLARRNLTKGQQAMALAMIYPEPDKRGRGNKGKSEVSSDFSQKRLAQARSVLRYSRPLAQEVLKGVMPLDKALEVARAAETQEQQRERRLKQLQAEWPDLVDSVVEERVSLEQAEQTASQRVEERKQLRWAATINLIDGIRPFERPVESAGEFASNFDAAIASQRGETITVDRVRKAAEFLNAVANQMEEVNGKTANTKTRK